MPGTEPMEGYVYKLDNVLPTWRRLYVVLHSDARLHYYESLESTTGAPLKEAKQLVSASPLDSLAEVGSRANAPPLQSPFYFCIVTDRSRKTFAVGSAEERTQWLAAASQSGVTPADVEKKSSSQSLLSPRLGRSDASTPRGGSGGSKRSFFASSRSKSALGGSNAEGVGDTSPRGAAANTSSKPAASGSGSKRSLWGGKRPPETAAASGGAESGAPSPEEAKEPSTAGLFPSHTSSAKRESSVAKKEPSSHPGKEKKGAGDGGSMMSKGPMSKGLVDRFLEQQLDRILGKIGQTLVDDLTDPHMPRVVNQLVQKTLHNAWPTVQQELRNAVLEGYALGDKQSRLFREMRLKHWAVAPPSWKRPFARLRALTLYALQPADATIWKVAQDPFALFVLALSVTPTLAVNVWVFVALFFLIDKRDEFQLVNYILKFKASQFVSGGLFSTSYASIKMYSCAMMDSCDKGAAPGTHATFPWEIAMEPVRLLFVWWAFGLLWCGHASGGLEEVMALEEVRIDAADGTLDGRKDVGLLREAGLSIVSRTSFDASYVQVVTDDARRRHGAKRRHGGVLPYFLVYDVLAALLSVGVISLQIWSEGLSPSHWMFWTSLYYMKAIYALLSLPFLAFAPWQMLLTHARATGYDRAGVLCASLTPSEIKLRYKMEQDHLALKANAQRKLRERHRQRLEQQRKQQQSAKNPVKGGGGGGGGGGGDGGGGNGKERRMSFDDTAATVLQTFWMRRNASSKAKQRRRGAIDDDRARLESHGTLAVHLSRAEHLHAADFIGTSDPYVKVRVAGQKRKSTVKRENLQPEYDETLLFKGRLRDFVFDELLLKVRDHDDFSLQADRLGEASVSLELLRDPKADHRPLVFDRLPLDFTPLGTGSITFSVTWQPKEDASSGQAAAAAAAKSRSNSPVESVAKSSAVLLPEKRGSSGKLVTAPAVESVHARDHTIVEEKTMLWK